MFIRYPAHQFLHVRIIAAAQAQEADFFKTAGFDHGVYGLHHLVDWTFAHRAKDHPGLAETAATRTAAHNLNRSTVVDDIDKGHNKLCYRGRHNRHHPLEHFRRRHRVIGCDRSNCPIRGIAYIVKGWHVNARNFYQAFQECFTVRKRDTGNRIRSVFHPVSRFPYSVFPLPRRIHCHHFKNDLFAFPDHHGVKKGAHRFGVVAARTTGDHKRVFRRAIGGAQRDAGQIQHCEHVGIKLFVGQAKADHVKVEQPMTRLQTVQRDGISAHQRFKIWPGAINALGKQIRTFVDQVVEHHQAQIAAAQLINIGKGQGNLATNGGIGPIFDNAVQFTAGVARRLFHFMQHTIQGAGNLFWGL